MADISMKVCDLCAGSGAVAYDVSTEEFGTWQVDLCQTCAAPLLANRPRQGHRFKKVTLPPQP